jgi:hypothetical protein
MGSFGQTDSREKSPVYATHSPEFANRFVWENGQLVCSEKKSMIRHRAKNQWKTEDAISRFTTRLY